MLSVMVESNPDLGPIMLQRVEDFFMRSSARFDHLVFAHRTPSSDDPYFDRGLVTIPEQALPTGLAGHELLQGLRNKLGDTVRVRVI